MNPTRLVMKSESVTFATRLRIDDHYIVHSAVNNINQAHSSNVIFNLIFKTNSVHQYLS
jgi:hypothetical protein